MLLLLLLLLLLIWCFINKVKNIINIEKYCCNCHHYCCHYYYYCYCHYRAVTNYPPALKLILTRNLAVANIINSLKVIIDDEALQLDTLKLIQIIAKTSEG